MIGKLFRPTSRLLSKSQPAKRLRELNEYLCLREATNPAVSKATLKELQDAAKETKLTPQQVTEVLTFVNYNPEIYARNFNSQDAKKAIRSIEEQYARSSLYNPGTTYEQFYNELVRRYPKLVPLAKPNSERQAAIETLEKIFLKDGPKTSEATVDDSVKRYIPSFASKVEAHIKTLKEQVKSVNVEAPKGHPTLGQNEKLVTHIESVLHRLLGAMEAHPAYFYGHIKAFVDNHRQLTGGEIVHKAQQTTTPIVAATTKSELANKPHHQVGNLEDVAIEDPLVLSNQYKSIIEKKSFLALPWIEDRKLIYEATVEENSYKLWSAVSALACSGVLYELIYRDIGVISWLSLGALTFVALDRFTELANLHQTETLVQINIHRDGKHVDLFIQGPKGVKKVEDVLVSDIKLTKGTKSTTLDTEDGENLPVHAIKRSKKLIGNRSLVYGDREVAVPLIYNGNRSVLQQIFEGKNVNFTD